jgi:hypothetical protein
MADTLYVRSPRLRGSTRARECWFATTEDGEWAFERLDEPGTPWQVIHWPGTERHERVTALFGSLRSARTCVERGLDKWLPSYQAARHAEGDYTKCGPYGCRQCADARWAK